MIVNDFTNLVSQKIWEDRYRKNNETKTENFRRVAKYCAQNKQEEENFFNLLEKNEFFPAGRTMSNAGIGDTLTMNNCFCSPKIEDSLEDIFDKVKLGAITHQKGGGIGYNFSTLRPKGIPTKNDAIASGPLSFMDVFNSQTATILQGNRRGANMAIMSIYHPDIVDFIEAKSKDPNRLTHFNLSVMVDDDFMNAKNNKETIWLHFPVYDEKGHIENDRTKWKVQKEVDALKIWNLVMQKAFDNGEPGILQSTTMNLDNNLHYCESITKSNPCFSGEMQLLTTNGYIPIKDLCNKEFKIVDKNGNISDGKAWKTGKKQTVKLTLSNAKEIVCTPNHIFMNIKGEEVEASNMLGQTPMPDAFVKNNFDNEYVMYGFVQGDGNLTRLNSQYHKGIEVNIGAKDKDVEFLFKNYEYTSPSGRVIYVDGIKDKLLELGFDAKVLPERLFPSTYNSWTETQKKSFLRGCYSANGCVIKGYRVSYKSTNREFIGQLSKTLFEDFGIENYVTTNKSHPVVFSNGEYVCKESYDLNIGRKKMLQIFADTIGFVHSYKIASLNDLLNIKYPEVVKIEESNVVDVYDFLEPNTHWGFIEGCVVHNCSEYLAGDIFGERFEGKTYGGACNLGSIMLPTFITNPFTEDASLDYDRLKNTIKVAVRMLDNIIDINKFPDPVYENYQKTFRTIGLGVTGLASLLTMLGIQYSSKVAQLVVFDLMGFISYQAYLASCELAKEKGEFEGIDREELLKSGYLKKHKWNDVNEMIRTTGIRNAKIMSVAPCGTMSLTFGNNCSSGVEPIFQKASKRKVKFGGQAEENAEIVDLEDYSYYLWKKFDSPLNIVDEEIFEEALKISVDAHINILSSVAYHVDMSVSKTINVPPEYTFEQTKEIYDKCWKAKIKGCTIFRPNELRQGILISDTTPAKGKDLALERGAWSKPPIDTIYYKRKLRTGCGRLNLFLGYSETTGKIHDLYTIRSGEGGCEKSVQTTTIAMAGMIRLGGDIFNIEKAFKGLGGCNSFVAQRAKGHSLSKGSSCGTAILYEIKAFLEEKGKTPKDIKTIPLKIVKASTFSKEEKEYLTQNGELNYVKHYNKCPLCNEKINHEGGCLSCGSCGFSKCD